jgi:hypothetical protein
MPTLFWLALLLGYLAGVAAAVLLLPARLIQPLTGPLTLATVIALVAFALLLRARVGSRRGRRTEATGAASPQAWTPTNRRSRMTRITSVADDGETAASDGPSETRWPLRIRLEPPGTIGPRELQRLLAEGQVDVGLRPIASLERPDAAVYHALPRVHTADGSHVAPAHYRASAARAGLLGLIDQRLVRRSAELLREARAEGREVIMLCSIAADSLTNAPFGAEIEQRLRDDPKLAGHLVLALDHVVRDQPGLSAMAGLRERGIRFCLRRIGPPPQDAAEVRAGGFDFVLLEAVRFALGAADGEPDPGLPELQRTFGAAGAMLLVGRTGSDDAAIVLPGNWALSADDGAPSIWRARRLPDPADLGSQSRARMA